MLKFTLMCTSPTYSNAFFYLKELCIMKLAVKSKQKLEFVIWVVLGLTEAWYVTAVCSCNVVLVSILSAFTVLPLIK